MNTKLNLGCGEFKKPGYINHDSEAHLHPDVVHDLDVFPYPFPDNHFTVVEADHVFEHLRYPFKTMREMARIMAPGGRLIIRVPHFSRGFTHADHKCGFDVSFPLYFNPTFKGGYTGMPWRLDSMQLRWFAQPYLKKTVLGPAVFMAAQGLGAIISFFANLSPFLCSRLWCYWVGGFEEIEFQFIKPKG